MELELQQWKLELKFLDDASGYDLESAQRWLRGEPELRGAISVRRAPVDDGAMGGALESLVVTVGPGGLLTVLATSITTWAMTVRRKATKVRVRVERDGIVREIEVEGSRLSAQELLDLCEGEDVSGE